MTPTIDDIKFKVCEVFNISMKTLMSRKRSASAALPRMVAYYLCLKYAGLSSVKIGQAFDRDHSTVIKGCREIFRIREKYPAEVAALVCHFHKLKNRKVLHLNYGGENGRSPETQV